MRAANQKAIYLDFNASTPLAPEVANTMEQALQGPFGNPSSDHWAGQPAREAVAKARSQVAGLLGCKPCEELAIMLWLIIIGAKERRPLATAA